MTGIGLISYYLRHISEIEGRRNFHFSIDVHKGGAQKVQDDSCKPIKILMNCGVKLSKCDKGEKMDATYFKSLVRSYRYLTFYMLRGFH